MAFWEIGWSVELAAAQSARPRQPRANGSYIVDSAVRGQGVGLTHIEVPLSAVFRLVGGGDRPEARLVGHRNGIPSTTTSRPSVNEFRPVDSPTTDLTRLPLRAGPVAEE